MAISPTELARVTGISVPYASQLLSGARKRPSPELALRIYEQTGLKLGLLEGLSEAAAEELSRKQAA